MGDSIDYGSDEYIQNLIGEGQYWDNFIAQRLSRGEIPGSIDWRLTFTQFRYNHGWRPFCLGPALMNFRLREIRYVLTEATRQSGARVLDLGCGGGWLSLELARRGAHVTALDISPTNLALGRYMAETNARNFPYLYQGFAGLPCKLEEFGSVEYGYADLNDVTLPTGEYDTVVVWDSLHHVANLERLLEEVRRALKPGGVFIGVDHAFASLHTELFNLTILHALDEFYAWVNSHDPEWLYSGMNDLARRVDWGVLGVDYDPTPVPNFGPFQEQLRSEMLDVIRSSQPTPPGEQVTGSDGLSGETESPFEDVSAERVMQALVSEFKVQRFNTVCPFIEPEKHISHYRGEQERMFQHFLAALMVSLGERAIAQNRADGQWFFFHLTPEKPDSRAIASMLETLPRPRQVELRNRDGGPASLDARAYDLDRRGAFLDIELESKRRHITNLETMLTELKKVISSWRIELDERQSYTTHLEEELQRKSAAIADIEARLQQRERELVAAREPKLPWKRRKR